MDDDDDVKPLRKRRVKKTFNVLTFEEFCTNYACRLKRGGKVGDKAMRELLDRYVDPKDEIDPEIIQLNIKRMLEMYEDRNNWMIVK